jgi:2-dehydropantoate 2-reductase
MVMNETPVLIVGTGAMASLFAALLSASNLKVRMLGTWKENIKALNECGVRFIDHNGQESIYPVEATDDPQKYVGSRLAIVLVKSYQTPGAAEKLEKCLAEDGVALTLQNGLGNAEILAEKLGAQRVLTGVTTVGATLIHPGFVRMGGSGTISIGDHEKAFLPLEILSRAGLKVEIAQDTGSLVWGKLVINASINPLSALLDVRNGGLMENPFARKMMKLITVESARVANKAGIDLPYPDPVEMVENVAHKTASNYSSMYIDFHRGGPTEIDAINGAIIRTGDEVGVPTEFNNAMWLLVNAKTATKRSLQVPEP